MLKLSCHRHWVLQHPSALCLHSHCIQQILESVSHCHLNGIVHRDLKVSVWRPCVWLKECVMFPGKSRRQALNMVLWLLPAFRLN